MDIYFFILLLYIEMKLMILVRYVLWTIDVMYIILICVDMQDVMILLMICDAGWVMC